MGKIPELKNEPCGSGIPVSRRGSRILATMVHTCLCPKSCKQSLARTFIEPYRAPCTATGDNFCKYANFGFICLRKGRTVLTVYVCNNDDDHGHSKVLAIHPYCFLTSLPKNEKQKMKGKLWPNYAV